MIASVVMLILLLSGLVATSGVNVAIRGQYNDLLMKNAAEAGVAMARACLDSNNLVATWTDVKPLKPNTDCNGDPITGAPAYVVNQGTVKTWFEVPAPIINGGLQSITAKSGVGLYRASNTAGAAYRTLTSETNFNSVVPLSFRNVGFGYSAGGAHFGVVMPTGEANMVGYNGDGRLGDGTSTDRGTPVPFGLPAGAEAARIFTNFLSIGYQTFVVTKDGDVYAAGDNKSGMLGVNSTAANIYNPLRVNLPAGVDVRFVGSGTNASFFIASNYNIYAAGECGSGQLGNGYTISGCANRTSANVRVALPAVNPSDPNTLPVLDTDWVQATNMANDRTTAYVRMQGGAVYGWGANDYGQLGDGTVTDRSAPVKMGTFGDAGQPKAVQIAFDGETVYILDDTGSVYVTGGNQYGDVAGAGSGIENGTSNLCIRYSGTVGVQATLLTCDDAGGWQRLYWMPDLTLRIGTSDTTTHCLVGPTAAGNPVTVQTCNPSLLTHRWTYLSDKTIWNHDGGCIATTAASATNGDGLLLRACNPANVTHTWNLQHTRQLRKVPIPSSAGTVTRVSTDNGTVLFLTTSGQVWGAGVNTRGTLGAGSAIDWNPRLLRYGTFNNVVDIYITTHHPYAAPGSTSDHNSSYVILSDGRVYGSGSNVFGQLGLGKNGSGVDIVSTQENTPREMKLPTGVKVKSIQSGGGTTLFISTGGEIYSVGNNANGQLGDGTTTNSSVPEARRYLNPLMPLVY